MKTLLLSFKVSLAARSVRQDALSISTWRTGIPLVLFSECCVFNALMTFHKTRKISSTAYKVDMFIHRHRIILAFVLRMAVLRKAM